ncbi:MAG TPA: hypothetical protein VGD21_12130 [Lysobacter sp.]
MNESYVLLWSQDRVKWLRQVKDHGPFEVVFGGPHISQPSIDRLANGDIVYPVAVSKGRFFVIARLVVQELLDPEEYVIRRIGVRPSDLSWNRFRSSLPDKGASVGHRAPWTCADLAACGQGTEFVWDRAVAPSELPELRFGPKEGRELPLKGIKDGIITSSLSLQGHMRRASRETATILSRVVSGERS